MQKKFIFLVLTVVLVTYTASIFPSIYAQENIFEKEATIITNEGVEIPLMINSTDELKEVVTTLAQKSLAGGSTLEGLRTNIPTAVTNTINSTIDDLIASLEAFRPSTSSEEIAGLPLGIQVCAVIPFVGRVCL